MIEISSKSKTISGSINLEASKSISNRLLIIRELCDNKFDIENLSNAKDTRILTKILNDFKKIQGLSILNIGCGNAFTYHHLFKFKPKSIYGIDVLNYDNAWNNVHKYVDKHNIKTEVKFDMIDIVNLDPSLKFDLIISEAVFEHCKDFKNVTKVLYGALKDNGVLYSSYGGPLWYTYGGDHFSGRDNEENGYNHLLLNMFLP